MLSLIWPQQGWILLVYNFPRHASFAFLLTQTHMRARNVNVGILMWENADWQTCDSMFTLEKCWQLFSFDPSNLVSHKHTHKHGTYTRLILLQPPGKTQTQQTRSFPATHWVPWDGSSFGFLSTASPWNGWSLRHLPSLLFTGPRLSFLEAGAV